MSEVPHPSAAVPRVALNGPSLKLESDRDLRHFDLGSTLVFRIGRSPDNDLVLDDVAASREHAIIRTDATGSILVDAGSRNGTLLNGRPVTAPARLVNKDIIQIGTTRMRFTDLKVFSPPSPIREAPATLFIPQQSLISVLVIDIRGFTPLSAELGEERISTLMSAVFQESGLLLDAARSWSQKFIGDAIMAVWKHDGDQVGREEIVAILTTIARLRELFTGLQARFGLRHAVVFGAAINTGPASIGNMGSGANADFTALGDTVNKTFRLETASKALGVDIVMGEGSFGALSPPVKLELLPPRSDVVLKGYDAVQSARLFLFSDLPRLIALLKA